MQKYIYKEYRVSFPHLFKIIPGFIIQNLPNAHFSREWTNYVLNKKHHLQDNDNMKAER